VTVCDRGGEQFVKVACAYVMNNLWFQRLQLRKYNILMFNKF